VIALMLASGRVLESWAAGRARRDLHLLLDRAPKWARRYNGKGLETVTLEAVGVGDLLMVASGEVVPADGTVLSSAVLDESAITGEPLPATKVAGQLARSGSVNTGAPFDMKVTLPPSERTDEGIVCLTREAQSSQAPMVRVADRFALWFLGLTLIVPGLAWALGGATRAVAVLVVATPCPLILAVPVALVAGLSRSARRGVVVKSGAALERLASCTTLVIDKTGTVTAGSPVLARVVPWGGMPAHQLLFLAASLEQASPHVLAKAVVDSALSRGCRLELPQDVREVPSMGIRAGRGGRERCLISPASGDVEPDCEGCPASATRSTTRLPDER
jgi:P-type E1-E2 ATPase